MDDFKCVFVWSGEVGEALWTGPHVTGAVVQGHQSTGGQGQLLFVVVAVVLLGEEMSWVYPLSMKFLFLLSIKQCKYSNNDLFMKLYKQKFWIKSSPVYLSIKCLFFGCRQCYKTPVRANKLNTVF